jgi:RNA polymerase sigma factor (sigma-70 family)
MMDDRQDDEGESFDRKYDQYRRLVQSDARRHGWNWDDSEEISQETFCRLLRRRQRADLPPIENLEGYLMTIARNVMQEMIADAVSGRSMSPLDDPLTEAELAYTPEYGAQLDDERRRHRLRSVLDELPTKCRVVAELHYLHGRRNQEVADLLKISINTVKKHLKIARRYVDSRMSDPE